MKKFILRHYSQHFWGQFDLEEYNDGVLVKTTNINRFCEVKKNYVIEYDAEGGSGIGWSKGEVIKKIYIGDAEFEKIIQSYPERRMSKN